MELTIAFDALSLSARRWDILSEIREWTSEGEPEWG
jgi:hypothetical protein